MDREEIMNGKSFVRFEVSKACISMIRTLECVCITPLLIKHSKYSFIGFIIAPKKHPLG